MYIYISIKVKILVYNILNLKVNIAAFIIKYLRVTL